MPSPFKERDNSWYILPYMIPKEFQEWINHELTQFFRKKSSSLEKHDPRIKELITQIAEMTLRGGDRQRPYFCYLGYSAAGKNDKEGVLPMLLALEIFHSFALIHDDLMDNANKRRGGPTIHAHFTKNLRNEGRATSLAILAGDLCAQWAVELFDHLVQGETLVKARNLFNHLREEVIGGQISDVWGMKGASLQVIREMYRRKSGNYSVAKPLILGALLGGGEPALIQHLTDYGEAVGLAFQLQDDLLGIFSNEKVTGKSTSGDIREGKWSLLIADTYIHLSTQDQVRLMKILGNPHSSAREIRWVRAQMEKTGAKKRVEIEMKQLVSVAKKSIVELSKQKRIELMRVAEYIIKRAV